VHYLMRIRYHTIQGFILQRRSFRSLHTHVDTRTPVWQFRTGILAAKNSDALILPAPLLWYKRPSYN
jgi:hypothetical protein